MPRTPLEAYAFDARFGKRSVFILDPLLNTVDVNASANNTMTQQF